MQHDLGFAPAVLARLLGAGLLIVALVVLVLAGLAAFTGLPAGVAVVTGAVGLFALGAIGLYLLKAAYVLRVTERGYRVRFVRGAGVTRARWPDVEDAITTYVADAPCVVLRLKDGGSTTIPVGMLALDREQVVPLLRAALDHGSGLRRLK